MKNYSLLVLLLLILGSGCALRRPLFENADDFVIEPMPKEDPFPGYEKASLIVDYVYDTGVTGIDRYWYEIIVLDTELDLHFHSRGTESYNEIEFEEERTLTAAQVKGVSDALATARSRGRHIGGGRFNSNVFSSDTAQQQVDAQIKRERADTSTISGNWDPLLGALRNLFPELKEFEARVIKGAPRYQQ